MYFNRHVSTPSISQERGYLEPQRCCQQALAIDTESAFELAGCLLDTAHCEDVALEAMLVCGVHFATANRLCAPFDQRRCMHYHFIWVRCLAREARRDFCIGHTLLQHSVNPISFHVLFLLFATDIASLVYDALRLLEADPHQ